MTSELTAQIDLSDYGYADGGYACKCAACKISFTGDKRAWSCKSCAEKKALEPKSISAAPAVPDVPELVRLTLIDHYGSNSEMVHVCSVEAMYPEEYVLHSQAAEIIAAKDREIERLKLRHTDEINDFILMGMARDEFKNRAEASEAKLAQYEAQEPVGVIHQGIFYSMADVEEYPEYQCGTKIYASPAPAADLKAEIIETCRKAVRNAVLKMPPEHRANADLCDDVIYRAIASLNMETSNDKG